MKKTYTTDEVIALHNEYMSTEYGRYYPEDASMLVIPFEQWLKEKEQLSLEFEMFANFSFENISEKLTLPVKDQLIWVWDYEGDTPQQRYFSEFDWKNEFPYGCFVNNLTSENTFRVRWWKNYSLTDPNQ